MHRFNSFTAFIEREAGHVILSVVLVAIGMLFLNPELRVGAARDLVVFGLGVLARSMGAQMNLSMTSNNLNNQASTEDKDPK